MKNLIKLMLLFFITSCTNKDGNESIDKAEAKSLDTIEISAEKIKNAEIQVGSFTLEKMNNEVKATGLIDVPPQNLASISTPMGGWVKETKVLPGSHVHKGEVLAVLEHQDYIQLQQDYLQAISRLELVQKEFARQKELYNENVSSSKKLQISDADYSSALAQANALREKLKLIDINITKLEKGFITSKIEIKATINGNIRSVNVSLGKFVSPSDVMYEIVDNSHLHLELRIFEKDILKIEEGQDIIFSVPTVSEETFKGVVYLVGKNFDSQTRTVLVHGHLEKEDKKRLLPGMYVNATIIAKSKKVKSLSEDAIVYAEGKNFIFIQLNKDQDKSVFKKLEVKTGLKANNKVEVMLPDGFIDQNNIVISGAYFINSEMNKTDE